MPRSDRDDSHERLRDRLTDCGLSPKLVDHWVSTFSSENISAITVNNICRLLWEIHSTNNERITSFNQQVESEKATRQVFLERIKEFVGETIAELENFANDARAAHELGIWLSRKEKAELFVALPNDVTHSA